MNRTQFIEQFICYPVEDAEFIAKEAWRKVQELSTFFKSEDPNC